MISPSLIRVVLLDDEPDHLQMMQVGLYSNDRGIEAVSTTSADEAHKLIRGGRFDCVVSDYLMPGMDGLRFCAKLREEGFDIPYILFTGQGSEEVAEKAFSVGVDDYLRKENTLAVYTVLVKNIRGLVERHRAEEALKISEEKYKGLFDSIQELVTLYEVVRDEKGEIVDRKLLECNNSFLKSVGVRSVDELRNKTWGQIFPNDDASKNLPRLRETMTSGKSVTFTHHRRDTDESYLTTFTPLGRDRYLVTGIDISDIARAERAVKESEERYRSLFEGTAEGAALHEIILDVEGKPSDYLFLEVNSAFEKLTGKKKADIIGKRVTEVFPGIELDPVNWIGRYGKVALTGEPTYFESYSQPLGRTYSVHAYSPAKNRFAVLFTDITESKKIEEEIRKAQRTFHELVERAPFGIYMVDSQFRVSHMNLGSQEGAFRNVRPIIGRDFSEVMRILWPENVAADIVSHFRHTLETGEPYYSPRFTNPRHDVEIVESYEWELHRMTLPDGQFGVICYYFDSTKLRDAEEALRVSEERYRQIVENATVGIYEIALGGDRFLSVNDATAQISGYTREELMAMSPMALLDEGSRAAFAERIRKKLAGEPIETPFEYKVVAKDGTMHTILLNDAEFRTKGGIPVSVVVIASDITDRKKAELALRDSEDRMRFALEASHTGAWDLDLVDHTAVRSLEHDRIFGYDALLPKWTYEMFLDHVLPEDRLAVDSKFKHAIETNGNWDFECRICRSDGVVRWIWAVGHHQFDESGTARRMAGIVQDITNRKQTEEVLRLRHAEIQTLFDNTPAGMVLFDAKRPYTVLVHNRYYQELFAEPYRSAGMRGLNIYQYAPEVEASGVAAVFDEVVETKKPKNYLDFPYKSDSSKETWFNWYMSPIIIDDKVVSLVSMSLDVTERHNATEALKKLNETLQQSEEELAVTNEELLSSNEELRISNENLSQSEEELAATSEELHAYQEELVRYSSSLEDIIAVRTKELMDSEEKLRSLMEATDDQYFQYDENLNLVYLNNAALRLYPGRSREELVGKPITTLTPGIEKTERYNHYLHTLRTGEPTFLYNLSDPAKIPGVFVDLRVYRIGSGIVVVSNDVTKKYLAEQRVKESEERLQVFMDSATEGFSLYDKDLNLVEVNRVVLDRFGLGTRKEDLLGKNIKELYPGIEETEWYSAYTRILETGEPFRIEAKPGVANHSRMLLNASAFKVGDGIGVISTDVTKRLELEARLRYAQRGEAIDKVSAMVAHDIRSPLNTAYQALEMVKLKPEQGEALMMMAEKSIKRAIEMIEDLRENTRLLAPRRQSVNLTALLDDTLREKHLPEGITVTTEYMEGLDSISLDPSMLRRVVENLLSNSTEAMPRGGRIKVTARKEGDGVAISVSDTGAGISPEFATKIFQPLFTTKTKGIGLGLDYCKRAVEAHGGTITFTSHPDEGTTFIIHIPK